MEAEDIRGTTGTSSSIQLRKDPTLGWDITASTVCKSAWCDWLHWLDRKSWPGNLGTDVDVESSGGPVWLRYGSFFSFWDLELACIPKQIVLEIKKEFGYEVPGLLWTMFLTIKHLASLILLVLNKTLRHLALMKLKKHLVTPALIAGMCKEIFGNKSEGNHKKNIPQVIFP